MFHAEFDATHDPVKRDQILTNAFSTVPGAELDSINVEYFLFRDNHGMTYFISTRLRTEKIFEIGYWANFWVTIKFLFI